MTYDHEPSPNGENEMASRNWKDKARVKSKAAPENSIGVESRLQPILDMLFDGILILQDGIIVEANQAILSMTGHEAADLVGHKIEELGGWKELGISLTTVSSEPRSFESVLPRKKSRPVYATVRAARTSVNGLEIVIAVVAGMAEAQPASESLLRSAERYRSLFEAIPDLVFIKDRSLRFSQVNPAVEKTLGLSSSQIIGRTAEEIFGQEAGERIRAWDLRVLSGETIEEERTLSVMGEKLTFHDVRVPIRNGAGEPIGVCGISRDISERRRAVAPPGINSHSYRSVAMKDTMVWAGQAAATDGIVLLLGESGSGKDHLARWIHEQSKRSGSPFLSINCAALPKELAESELFGYESGAFTGARNRKKGLLELAEGGSLLLNEIAEMSPSLQSKLLTFLDSKSFHRLGGQRMVNVDARIIAATHRDLEGEVAANRFSKPLFYRLNVLPIRVPPLRERIEDIPQISLELISRVAQDMNLPRIPALDAESLKSLMKHNWPGNVRELRNVLERGLIMWQGGKLVVNIHAADAEPDPGSVHIAVPAGKQLRELSREFERQVCVLAIRRHGGNRTAAARSLGVSRDSFYRHLRVEDRSRG